MDVRSKTYRVIGSGPIARLSGMLARVAITSRRGEERAFFGHAASEWPILGTQSSIDLLEVDSIAQDTLQALSHEASRENRLFAVCRLDTEVAGKTVSAFYDASSWQKYLNTLSPDATAQDVLDPRNRQAIVRTRAYLTNPQRRVFKQIYDSAQDAQVGWNYSLLTLIAGRSEDWRTDKLLTLAMIASTNPSLRTSLWANFKKTELAQQWPDLSDVATRALAKAAALRLVEPMAALVRLGADVDGTDEPMGRPLFNAAANGDRRLILSLLAYGASPNQKDATSGETAMHVGAYFGDPSVLTWMKRWGGDETLENNSATRVDDLYLQMAGSQTVALLKQYKDSERKSSSIRLDSEFRDAVAGQVQLWQRQDFLARQAG